MHCIDLNPRVGPVGATTLSRVIYYVGILGRTASSLTGRWTEKPTASDSPVRQDSRRPGTIGGHRGGVGHLGWICVSEPERDWVGPGRTERRLG